MYRISSRGFEFAQTYINDVSSIYFINILTGKTEGIVWGDKEESPDMLLLWSEYQQGFQLMGKTIPKDKWPEFYQWFQKTIVPFMMERGIEDFEYGVDNEELAYMMDKTFCNKEISRGKQKIFIFGGVPKSSPLPDGYTVEKIDRNLYENNYRNMNYIIREIDLSYGSWDKFLKNGYGYAAIKNGEIAARAVVTFNYGGKANISVDTVQNHRNKGLSSYIVNKTIEEALRRNETPVWDCDEDNIPSVKTALKCGFSFIREDNIYWFSVC